MAPTPTAASRRPSATIARAAQNRSHRARELGRDGGALDERLAEQLRGGGEGARQPALAGVGRRGGLGRGVEQHRHDVHAGDAVDERVVGLRQHREAVALEPVDQPDLPERLVAVELLGEDASGEVLELLLRARSRQRGGAHVVAQVQVGVVDPPRPALAERHERQALAVARHQPEAALDGLEQLVVGRRRPFEDHHAGHVHVGGAVLQMEERRVEPCQSIRGHGPRLDQSDRLS